ncbi:phage tail sheath subtilisin-like domain-containing protein [Mesorhizobium sp. Cs1299R1N3]|uniref:phage tail sheath subtilisin-like domain-containing protein n=1 Tax=Mesorhizobium sp. Cs1299R1N3 TaxID=3015173 RepID=UPI00301D10B3
MADLAFHHGTRVFESGETPILIRTNQTRVILLVGTAPDADEALFPVNMPVLIPGLPTMADQLGDTGTLPDALDAIFKQDGPYILVVRVEEGVDAPATLANIIGDRTAMTGVWAGMKAEPMLGIAPVNVVVAGYSGSVITNGVTSVAVDTPGTGYTAATVAFAAAPAGGVTALGEAVIVAGAITAIKVTRPGKGYTAVPAVTITGDGANAAATATTGNAIDPITAELTGLVDQLKAIAYIDGPNTTDADAVAFRGQVNSQRIYIADPKVLVYDKVAAANVSKPFAPFLVGVRTRTDRDFGFWWSVSNKPVFGIVGMARPIAYGAQANYLNERAVNTVINVNGEGLRTWGNRVATGDDLWKFEAVRRTADVINRALADAYLEFVDKPFSKANLKFMLESGNTFLRSMKNEGAILGGRCFIRADDNPAANLASGSPTISVEFEPPAPMEDIRIKTYRNIAYYDLLLEQVLKEVNNGSLTTA